MSAQSGRLLVLIVMDGDLDFVIFTVQFLIEKLLDTVLLLPCG